MNFILPGFYEKFHINKKLIELYNKKSNFFIDNFNFGCFYGNFGFNIWSGGRIFNDYQTASKEYLNEIKNFYNNNNIPIRLTLTNTMIQEEHLYDSYCNFIVSTLQNGQNEIVTSSPLLEEYLKHNYPDYSYCSSTTKCITNIDTLKQELNKDYYQVCLDYNLNHNFSFLDQLIDEEKFKCEFLCNAICPPGCPFRKEHYRLNSLFSLNGGKLYTINCQIKGNTLCQEVINYNNNISPQEIQNTYIPKGFSHFKLEGRTLSDPEIVLNLVRYCIKPEYQLEATLELL